MYLKLTFPLDPHECDESSSDAKKATGTSLFKHYLNSADVVSTLELNDLCLTWLCAIHLEAFGCMPSWLRASSLLSNKIGPHLSQAEFWHSDANGATEMSIRNFSRLFMESVRLVYKLRSPNAQNEIVRNFDLFILPWSSKSASNAAKYDLEKIKSMFHDALKSMTSRCSVTVSKQKIYIYSLPLFINLISLEVANRRYDVASKFCERLLKSAETEMFKELWLSLVYIQQCQIAQVASSAETSMAVTVDEGSLLLENTFSSCLRTFPFDAQIRFLACKYYVSIVRIYSFMNVF